MNKSNSVQNYNVEKRANRDARPHALHQMEELENTQNWEITELVREELRECQNAVTQLTAQIQELQDKNKIP